MKALGLIFMVHINQCIYSKPWAEQHHSDSKLEIVHSKFKRTNNGAHTAKQNPEPCHLMSKKNKALMCDLEEDN